MKYSSCFIKKLLVLLNFFLTCFVFTNCSYQKRHQSLLIGLEIVPQSVIAPSSKNTPLKLGIAASINDVEIVPGSTIQFVAYALYTSGPKQDVTTLVTWNSSNPAVATIIEGPSPSGGLATVLGTGTGDSTVISATLSNGMRTVTKSNAASITIVEKVLTSLQITPAFQVIAVSDTQQYLAMGTYSTGNLSQPVTEDITSLVSWNSDNVSAATINAGPGGINPGLTIGVGNGETHITAALNGIVSDPATLNVGPPQILNITISPSASSIVAGGTQQYTAIGAFSYGPIQNITNTVTWSSSNMGAATIPSGPNPNPGLATGVAVGTTYITATSDAVTSNTSTLSVTDAVLTSITITPNPASIATGLTQQFTATGTYSDGSTSSLTNSVTWNSTIPSVATINVGPGGINPGLATGVSLGTSQITANLGAIASPAVTLEVTTASLVSIAITPDPGSVPAGITLQFTATGTYSTGPTQDITSTVTWTSATPGVATINAGPGGVNPGLVTGVTTGTSQITATLGAVTSPAVTLTVTSPLLVSIAITPEPASVAQGLTRQFTATGTYTAGPTQDITSSVTWASATPGVATINVGPGGVNPGLATGVTTGTSQITANLGAITSPSVALTITAPILISIVITPDPASVAQGLTRQFTATGTYTAGPTQDITSTVTWASATPGVATINAGSGGVNPGLATGVTLGTSQITANLGAITSPEVTLTVTSPALISIAVTPDLGNIYTGETIQFTATGTYTAGPTQDITSTVTWASATPGVATIDAGPGGSNPGLATGISAGTSQITANFGAITSPSVTLTVTAPTLVSIAITPDPASVAQGLTQQFTAIGTYNAGPTQDITSTVTWASATPGVATINAGPGGSDPGLATGVTLGTSQIAANLGAITSPSVTLTVTAATLVSIAITPDPASVAAGLTTQFTAIGTYSAGPTQNITTTVTWASATPGIATINAGPGGSNPGRATGVTTGTSQITATLGPIISPSVTLTVTPALLVSITVTPMSLRMGVGGSPKQMTATGTYTNGNTQNLTGSVTWSFTSTPVSPSSISLSGGGIVTPLASGSAVVTATDPVTLISGNTAVIVLGNLVFSSAISESLGVVRGSYLNQTGVVVISPGDLYYLTNNNSAPSPTICDPRTLSFDNNNNLWVANESLDCVSGQTPRTVSRFPGSTLNTPGSPMRDAAVNQYGVITIDRYGNLWLLVGQIIRYYRAADLTNSNPVPYMRISSSTLRTASGRSWIAVDNTKCNDILSVCDVWVSQHSFTNNPRNVLKYSTSQMGAASGEITINTPSLIMNGNDANCPIQNPGPITFDPSGNLWLGTYLATGSCTNPNLTRFAPSYLAQTGTRTPAITTNVVDNFYVSLSGDYRVGGIFLDAGGNLWIGNNANTGSVGILEFDLASLPNQSRPIVTPAVPVQITQTLTVNSNPNVLVQIAGLALN